MKSIWNLVMVVSVLCGTIVFADVANADVKRTASGVPDLSGFYDGGTLTPLNRPEALGDKQFMTREDATEILHQLILRHRLVQTCGYLARRLSCL